jgi:hypothetical protein
MTDRLKEELCVVKLLWAANSTVCDVDCNGAEMEKDCYRIESEDKCFF